MYLIKVKNEIINLDKIVITSIFKETIIFRGEHKSYEFSLTTLTQKGFDALKDFLNELPIIKKVV